MGIFEKDGISFEIPEGLKYGKSHVWAKVEGDEIIVGVTNFVQKVLQEITYVGFTAGKDDEVKGVAGDEGDPFVMLESAKAYLEILLPATGTISETHLHLEEDPTSINNDCYGNGWLVKIKGTLVDGLLDANDYAAFAFETAKALDLDDAKEQEKQRQKEEQRKQEERRKGQKGPVPACSPTGACQPQHCGPSSGGMCFPGKGGCNPNYCPPMGGSGNF